MSAQPSQRREGIAEERRRQDGSLVKLAAYKTIGDDIVLLEYGSRHLSMLVVVVLDEGFVTHSRLLLNEYRGLDYLAEAGSAGIAGLEYHCELLYTSTGNATVTNSHTGTEMEGAPYQGYERHVFLAHSRDICMRSQVDPFPHPHRLATLAFLFDISN